jgi:hypothetical protein
MQLKRIERSSKWHWLLLVTGGTALLIHLTGCFGPASVSGLTESSTTVTNTETSTTSTLTNVKAVVTTGSSLSFNIQSAGANAMALNPSTRLPGVAYVDAQTNATGTTAVGALKLAQMNASGAWDVEVIDLNYGTAACGTANSFCVGAMNAATGSTSGIVSLAYKSNGLPAIAYVFGPSAAGTGNKQIRLAEKDSSGNWTITVAFSSSTAAAATNVATANTVDPMKGVRLLFDSNNYPHIFFSFYAQTPLANSYLKYAFRGSSGSWENSDVATLVTGAGAINGLGQGAQQIGAALCPLDGLPHLAYGIVDGAAGAGKPAWIRCTAKNTDGRCTTWGTQLILSNGCTGATSCLSGTITTATNANTRMDLEFDAATNRPIFALYSTATPNTSLVTFAAPSACNVAQATTAAAWGAVLTVDAASDGQNGFKYATSTSSANTNFLYFLRGTTIAMMQKQTGVGGAWLATAATVHTTTLAGQGAGMVYDATNDIFYGSHASLPAGAAWATGNDLIVSSGTAADITSAATADNFMLHTVDNLALFFPNAAVPLLDTARAPDGTHGHTYFFQDSAVGDSKLYYGVRTGTAAAPGFISQAVTPHMESAASPQFVGSYPSLAYDTNSNPIIAHYNGVTAEQNLNVAVSPNKGSTFSTSVVDNTSANVGQYPSVATTGSTVGIAYYDVTNTGLKFARLAGAGGWRRFAVAGMTGATCGVAGDDAGKWASLRFTSTGRPVIVYQSQSALYLAVAAEAATSTSYTWTCVALDAGANTRGEGIAFVLDSNDRPHIAHFDATAGAIRYVTCSSAVGTCASTGASAFTGSLVSVIGTTSTIVTKPAIGVNTSGTVYIAHYSATSQALVLQSMASGASSFTAESLDANSSGATYTSLVGQYPSMVINSSGYPSVMYRSAENWLRYYSRESL